MLDKAQRISIFANMNDEAQHAALAAMGVDASSMDTAMKAGDESGSKMTSWNNTEVSVPATKRGPFLPKDFLFTKEQPEATRPMDGVMLGQPEADTSGGDAILTGLM